MAGVAADGGGAIGAPGLAVALLGCDEWGVFMDDCAVGVLDVGPGLGSARGNCVCALVTVLMEFGGIAGAWVGACV